ncbi:SsgA family sporulation/cell division regulator [Streptomyces sp. NPDC019539]|uniref:SsgA family sporulation/cell division regulator n=1 Tax=Streptomyces sp. NPDC019539 TaxID=3365063 RepID=UPI00379DCF35
MHLPIATSFHYTTRDPYAARVTFHPDPPNMPGLTWCVERDLLSAGTCTRAGAGDVQAWPAHGPSGARSTLLQIGPPSGRAVFRVDTAALREWLALTHHLVPPGTETSH